MKPNRVFHRGAAVPGKAHGGWGGEVLWPLGTAKSTFSLSVWGQQGVAEGSSHGRGGCLWAEFCLSFGNGLEQCVPFLESAPGAWSTG